VSELAVVLVFTATGFLAVRAVGIPAVPAAVVSFPVGVAAFVGVALLLVSSGFPSLPLLAFALAAGALAGLFLVRRIQGRVPVIGWRPFVAVLAIVTAVHAAVQFVHLENWHTDSLFNAESALLFASGQPDQISSTGAAKRLLALPYVMALSIELGAGVYLESFAPLLAVSALALTGWLLHCLVPRMPAMWTIVVVALPVLALLTNNRFVFHAFYVNGHLLFAVLLLILVGFVAVRARSADAARGWVHVAAGVIPALVVTRAEASLVVGLVLVVVWALNLTRSEKLELTLVAGGSITIWHLYLTLLDLQLGDRPPLSSYGLLVAGVLLMLAPFVLIRLPEQLRQMLPTVVEIALWAALLVFFVWSPMTLLRSGHATMINLFAGAGGWGLFLVALGTLAVLALVLYRGAGDRLLRFTLSSSLPLFLLLAYLREGAYRVGDGDSLNRMWLQLLPLLILFLAGRLLTGEPRWRWARGLVRGRDEQAAQSLSEVEALR